MWDKVFVQVENGTESFAGWVEKDIPAQCLAIGKPKDVAAFWSKHLDKDIGVGSGIVWSVKTAEPERYVRRKNFFGDQI